VLRALVDNKATIGRAELEEDGGAPGGKDKGKEKAAERETENLRRSRTNNRTPREHR
jgi:hypothetical protein